MNQEMRKLPATHTVRGVKSVRPEAYLAGIVVVVIGGLLAYFMQ